MMVRCSYSATAAPPSAPRRTLPKRSRSPTAWVLTASNSTSAAHSTVDSSSRTIRCPNHRPPSTRCRLCTLAEALDACGDRMLVNVEIKNWKEDAGYDPSMSMVAPIIDELRRRGPRARHRWLISSFSWSTVAACREHAPDLATACLTSGAVDPATIERLAAAGHSALHPREPQVDEELMARCHRSGLSVNTWTCNDPVRLVELAGLGVDGVCTDVPDVALSALGRTGASDHPSWPAR
jgi:glycerophosphoryl diester phosphodiesterase